MTTEDKIYEAIAKTLVGVTTSKVVMQTAVVEAKEKVKVKEQDGAYSLEVPAGWAATTKRRIQKVVSKAVPYGTLVEVS